MPRKRVGRRLMDKLRGSPVNTRVRICIDCGGTRITITEREVLCKSCGATHRRRDITNLTFKPGDMVRIADSERAAGLTYRIHKLSQDADGVMHYVLRSKSSPIALFYHENSESHLERV